MGERRPFVALGLLGLVSEPEHRLGELAVLPQRGERMSRRNQYVKS